MKNLLAVALIVCVASLALSQPPEPAPVLVPAGVPVPVIMQSYEYKVTDRGGFNPPAWETKLNDMAREGWELDAIDQGEGHYIFRRHVQPAPGVGGGGFF